MKRLSPPNPKPLIPTYTLASPQKTKRQLGWLPRQLSPSPPPQGETTQASFFTLGLELPAEQHKKSKVGHWCIIYHPDLSVHEAMGSIPSTAIKFFLNDNLK
jgi:hypothetical protein